MRLNFLIIVVAATSVFLSPAHARQGVPRNAALKYWAAWSKLDQATREKVVASVDWETVGKETDPARLPQSFRDAAAAVQPALIDALIEPTNLAECDFEIDYEKGFDALLPHLSKARDGARVLRLHARASLVAGDARAAARDTAAMYRLAAHMTSDQVLISGLVAAAIASMADTEAELLASSGKLGAADRDAIVAAMKTADEADPFGVERGVAMENRICSDWIRANFVGPDAGKRLAPYVATTGKDGGEVVQLTAMDGEALAVEVHRYTRLLDEVVGAWNAPDAVERLRRIEEKAQAGEYGLLGRLMVPAFSKAHASDVKARAARAGILEALANARVGG